MKEKCELNLRMARVLSQDKDHRDGWNTSIHCSYYAVFQYMKYLLAEKAKTRISYDDQDKQQENSHKYILEEIKNRIKNSNNARRIRDRILNLRQHRIAADYHPQIPTQEVALECEREAVAIINNLSTLISA